jgi:hypothetical protein
VGYKLEKIMAKYNRLWFQLLWIEIKYFFIEHFLRLTWRLRLKYTKHLILDSHAYHDHTGEYTISWDDVDVKDQWGMYLPFAFGIVSKANYDFDQKINRDIGEPEDPWKEVVHHPCEKHMKDKQECPLDCGWTTYYFEDEYLNSKHYFTGARKHLNKVLGDKIKDKDFHLHLTAVSQQFLLDEAVRVAEWVKDGKKPFKIEFSDQAKEDFKKLLGEEDATEFFKEQEERNKDIDDGKRPDTPNND